MNIISMVDEEGKFPRLSFDWSAINRAGFDWLCIKTQSGNTSSSGYPKGTLFDWCKIHEHWLIRRVNFEG